MLFPLSVTFWLSSAFKSTTGWNCKIAPNFSPQCHPNGEKEGQLFISRLTGVCFYPVCWSVSEILWSAYYRYPTLRNHIDYMLCQTIVEIETSTNMLAALPLPDHVWRAASQTDISECHNFHFVFQNKHFRSVTIFSMYSQTKNLVSPFSYPLYIPVPVFCIIWGKLIF